MADQYLSPLGFNFIRGQEGFRAKPYWDVRQWSTGYGTRASGPDDAVDRTEADRRLASEAGKVSSYLNAKVTTPLSQPRHDALVSFGYNLGTDDIGKLLPDINSGNWDNVGRRMLSFNHAGGNVNAGLTARRAAEAKMLGGAYSDDNAAGNADMAVRSSSLAQALNPGGAAPIGGAPVAGGPVPLTAPSPRQSKLADILLAQGTGASVRGWGDAIRALSSSYVGKNLSDKADEQQGAYRGSLAQALTGAGDADAMAKTLMSSGDDDLVKQGVALKVAQAKPQSDRFMSTPRGVFDKTTQQYVPGTEKAEVDEHGTTPHAWQDVEGVMHYTQLSKTGGRKDIELPPGAKWLPGVEWKDTGTALTPLGKKTGDIVGQAVPKNVAGEAQQKEVGKAQGERQMAQPATNASMRNSLSGLTRLMEEARGLKGMEGVEGMTGVLDGSGWVPTVFQSTADAEAKLTTLKSQIAFNVLQALRDASKTGGALGAVSEKELALLENNLASLDKQQGTPAFKANLDRIVEYAQGAMGRLRSAYRDTYGQDFDENAAAPIMAPANAAGSPDAVARKQKYGLE